MLLLLVLLLLAMLLKVKFTFLSWQGVGSVRVFPNIHWLGRHL